MKSFLSLPFLFGKVRPLSFIKGSRFKSRNYFGHRAGINTDNWHWTLDDKLIFVQSVLAIFCPVI